MDQFDFVLGQVSRQQPQRDVVGPGMELHRYRFVAQRTGVIMRGIGMHQDGLSGDCRTEGDDAGALLAFIGPTGLTFFSSAVDRYLRILERHVA